MIHTADGRRTHTTDGRGPRLGAPRSQKGVEGDPEGAVLRGERGTVRLEGETVTDVLGWWFAELGKAWR